MLQQVWQQGMPRATVVGGPSFGSAAPLRAAIVAQGGHFLFEVPPDTIVRPYYPIPRPIPVHAALAAERGTAWAMTDVSPVNAQTSAPGWEHAWLIARRPSPHSPSTTYYLASGVQPTVHTLCRLTAAREAAAQRLRAAQDTVGLGHAEVRHWQSWYRHATLALIADAWRCVTQRTVRRAR